MSGFVFSEVALAAVDHNTTRSNRATSLDTSGGDEVDINAIRLAGKKIKTAAVPEHVQDKKIKKPPFVHYK